ADGVSAAVMARPQAASRPAPTSSRTTWRAFGCRRSSAVLEIQPARHGLVDVRDLGIWRPRRVSELAELLARGGGVGSCPFLVHLDGKICSAKSKRSRHRDCEKGISDFVEKFVSHNQILPVARPNFS